MEVSDGTQRLAKRVLLTGATGYVGGRLLSLLEQRGALVRCLARRPEALGGRVGSTTETVAGDVLDAASLAVAFQGVDTAYYFVHSMGADRDFEEQDRIAATNFAQAATAAGVRRIIYLGGLGDPDETLSKHLRSRQETGELLRKHHPAGRRIPGLDRDRLRQPVVRDAPALVERLPVMICPRWVRVMAQPIAVEDLLAYLLEALDLPDGPSQIYEIGGPDQVSYGQIMHEYARQRGLRRWMILGAIMSDLTFFRGPPCRCRVSRACCRPSSHLSIAISPSIPSASSATASGYCARMLRLGGVRHQQRSEFPRGGGTHVAARSLGAAAACPPKDLCLAPAVARCPTRSS